MCARPSNHKSLRFHTQPEIGLMYMYSLQCEHTRRERTCHDGSRAASSTACAFLSLVVTVARVAPHDSATHTSNSAVSDRAYANSPVVDHVTHTPCLVHAPQRQTVGMEAREEAA